MKQPSGHEQKGKENFVWLLLKALYGTKQAAHAWQLHLRKLLAEEGFMPLVLDPATYAKRDGDAFTLVGTHVDDLFVVSNGQGRKMKESLWNFLFLKLPIKTLADAHSKGCQGRGAQNIPRVLCCRSIAEVQYDQLQARTHSCGGHRR